MVTKKKATRSLDYSSFWILCIWDRICGGVVAPSETTLNPRALYYTPDTPLHKLRPIKSH